MPEAQWDHRFESVYLDAASDFPGYSLDIDKIASDASYIIIIYIRGDQPFSWKGQNIDLKILWWTKMLTEMPWRVKHDLFFIRFGKKVTDS